VAHLRVEGDELVVRLSKLEEVEAAHGHIRVPLTAVHSLTVAEDPWPHLRGIRAPGTGIPHVIAVGTRRGTFGKDFVAVHGKGRSIVVELTGADYQRFIVTDEDAVDVVAAINAARATKPQTDLAT
jgi:hypothetical protein